jgi:aspartyl-tRNA(Asn)/glutamyl-tRNA(Gln) amidotransferase subunit C
MSLYSGRNFFRFARFPARGASVAAAADPSRISPMPLSPEDVSRIAHLARLELSPAEGSAMQTQLNDFFKIVEQMSAVDTSGLEPLHTPLSAIGDVELRLRPDAVTETNNREANMANAPAAEEGLFLVPKVIE